MQQQQLNKVNAWAARGLRGHYDALMYNKSLYQHVVGSYGPPVPGALALAFLFAMPPATRSPLLDMVLKVAAAT